MSVACERRDTILTPLPMPPDPTRTTTPKLLTPQQALALLQAAKPDDDPAEPQRWSPPAPAEIERSLPGCKVERLIGRGGMGAVYAGEHLPLKRKVAIKILPPQAGLRPNSAERFHAEACVMAGLSHPNIVQVYDAGETAGGLPYFLMELVEGGDVRRLLAEKGRLDPHRALEIASHVCDALAYAHEQGVIHRDINPANVMLEPSGVVKVADFGIAKILSAAGLSLTAADEAIGTPDFIPPEAHKIGSAKCDHRGDIYSAGALLYVMLTGRLPRGNYPPPSQAVPGIPPGADAIVQQAMRQDPAERFLSAAAMRDEMDALLRTMARSAQPGRGGRLPLAAAAAAVLLLAGWFLSAKLKPSGNPDSAGAFSVSPQIAAAVQAEIPHHPAASRTAAETMLARGGFVVVTTDGNNISAKSTSELPAEPFRLIDARFDAQPGVSKLEPGDLEKILAARELEVLQLQDAAAIDGAACRALAAMPKLKILSLQNAVVTDDQIAGLAGLRRLTGLNLASTAVTDAGLARLAPLGSLQHLDVSNTAITAGGLSALPAPARLRTIKIGSRKVPAGDLARWLISHARALESLWLAGPLSSGDLAGIEQLMRLSGIGLSRTVVTADMITAVSRVSRLKRLTLEGCEADEAAWRAFGELDKITSLRLVMMDPGPAFAEAARGMAALDTITLAGTSQPVISALQSTLPGVKIIAEK